MATKSAMEGLSRDDGIRKETLCGSESIARAVVDAGAAVVASYPGGPVTGIVEKLIELSASCDLYVEWSNCEKVAFEVALGCSLAGRRSVLSTASKSLVLRPTPRPSWPGVSPTSSTR